MATAKAIDYNRDTRWSKANLETCRKRRYSDATIAKHVRILEGLAKAHDNVLPPYKWLNANGYFGSYEIMRQYPQAFAHIKTSSDKKFEIYQAKETAVAGAGKILPPSNATTLAKYHVPGALFNPTQLHIEPGASEAEWMEIGRSLASVCQAAYWWVGDWIQYGFKTYGKKTTFDLAQQATGYTRGKLYECAYIASRFPPARRCGVLTFFHHQCLAAYPPALADKVLTEAAELGLTGRQAKEIAQEETGKPKARTHHPLQLKKVTVSLYGPSYDRLKASCKGCTVDALISRIIEEWLEKE